MENVAGAEPTLRTVTVIVASCPTFGFAGDATRPTTATAGVPRVPLAAADAVVDDLPSVVLPRDTAVGVGVAPEVVVVWPLGVDVRVVEPDVGDVWPLGADGLCANAALARRADAKRTA